jgi:hypothetical protein
MKLLKIEDNEMKFFELEEGMIEKAGDKSDNSVITFQVLIAGKEVKGPRLEGDQKVLLSMVAIEASIEGDTNGRNLPLISMPAGNLHRAIPATLPGMELFYLVIADATAKSPVSIVPIPSSLDDERLDDRRN